MEGDIGELKQLINLCSLYVAFYNHNTACVLWKHDVSLFEKWEQMPLGFISPLSFLCLNHSITSCNCRWAKQQFNYSLASTQEIVSSVAVCLIHSLAAAVSSWADLPVFSVKDLVSPLFDFDTQICHHHPSSEIVSIKWQKGECGVL